MVKVLLPLPPSSLFERTNWLLSLLLKVVPWLKLSGLNVHAVAAASLPPVVLLIICHPEAVELKSSVMIAAFSIRPPFTTNCTGSEPGQTEVELAEITTGDG